MSCYSFIYLLKLNIVGDFTKMNIENESEKSSLTPAAPMWKYVTRLEKANVGGGNISFKCNYCKKNFQGVLFKGKGTLVKTA